jgi:hypothetical protein
VSAFQKKNARHDVPRVVRYGSCRPLPACGPASGDRRQFIPAA